MTMLLPIVSSDGAVRALALVDATDWPDVRRFTWYLSGHDRGYAVRATRVPRGRVSLHRHLMGLAKGDIRQVDHINRTRLDNRRRNLRIVTGAQQAQNQPGNALASSRYRGVYFNKSAWVAQVRVEGRKHYLGRHATQETAAKVAADFRRAHMPFSEDALEVAS